MEVAEARTYLGDFLPPDTVKSMDDAAVLSHHKQFSDAVAKHAPKADTGVWYDKFTDPQLKEWVKTYGNGSGLPSAEAAALKAWNLEKFVGAEKAGRGVIMPKADAKPEEWNAFFKKTGMVPEKVDGYKIPDKAKDDAFMGKFREHAHKMGVPAPIFDALTGFIMSEAEARASTHMAEFDKKAETEMAELRGEWGANYDANSELAQRAAASFIPHKDKADLEETLTRMEAAMGTKFTMNLFASIGKGISEHSFVMGDAVQGDGSMTPEAARNRIEALKKDPEFARKLNSGDADTKAEWDKLNRIGYSQSV